MRNLIIGKIFREGDGLMIGVSAPEGTPPEHIEVVTNGLVSLAAVTPCTRMNRNEACPSLCRQNLNPDRGVRPDPSPGFSWDEILDERALAIKKFSEKSSSSRIRSLLRRLLKFLRAGGRSR